MIHNFESMFDRLKALTIALDRTLSEAERVTFFDDDARVRVWLEETERWCRETAAGDFDLGPDEAIYQTWLAGQTALAEWTVPVSFPPRLAATHKEACL